MPRQMNAVAHAFALALLASAACGAGDPQAPGTCDAAWVKNGFTKCDAACADSGPALGAMGPSCDATTASGADVNCSKTFAYDGVTGCCAADPPRAAFAECK